MLFQRGDILRCPAVRACPCTNFASIIRLHNPYFCPIVLCIFYRSGNGLGSIPRLPYRGIRCAFCTIDVFEPSAKVWVRKRLNYTGPVATTLGANHFFFSLAFQFLMASIARFSSHAHSLVQNDRQHLLSLRGSYAVQRFLHSSGCAACMSRMFIPIPKAHAFHPR